jgi:bifunctional DNA-binding transcriptional regulator/antitoxin component of YhaV-PrlF toxin-antitoxin module
MNDRRYDMASVLGAKGQVVIEKPIRDALALEPGAVSVQKLVGDHVEIYFLPPEHNRSLAGVLKPWVSRSLDPEKWQEVREKAWADSISAEQPDEEDGP